MFLVGFVGSLASLSSLRLRLAEIPPRPYPPTRLRPTTSDYGGATRLLGVRPKCPHDRCCFAPKAGVGQAYKSEVRAPLLTFEIEHIAPESR